MASRGFVDTSVAIHPEKKSISVSRIFQWYRSDFGGRDGIIDFLIRYLPDDRRREFVADSRDKLKVRFSSYDWRLNSV